MINLQPVLENELILLQPLQQNDFERLYAVASDPLIWEQHPNKDRYKREVFQTYFEGAMESKGALLLIDKLTGGVAGSSRFYDYNETESSLLIGYTFIARKFWGKAYNPAMKTLMIDHAFQYVDKILFHIGANNTRSQIAIGRIGAVKQKEISVAYHGEPEKLNFEYFLTKKMWKPES
ncbi:GNAT family N-acetyltransferase [Lacibacter sp. H375]|uniref:GNAT family N-acetyltransferase n=1 Tax=Lacibacter sp. H375 TaxID=3133424 RepID=UPI0030BD9835